MSQSHTKPKNLPAPLPYCTMKHCGKMLRSSLRNRKLGRNLRIVPAFTIQALQKNTVVAPPPSLNIYDSINITTSTFITYYDGGKFPVDIKYGNFGKKLVWRIAVAKLDYEYYLPLFFEGMTIEKYPYNFIAHRGLSDLLNKAPHKVLPVLPQLVIPIKKALSTKNPALIGFTMDCIQKMVKNCNGVGQALVPYYRHLLPIFNLFHGKGDIAETVEETLNILEIHGGPDAFINIKSIIPTYESFVNN